MTTQDELLNRGVAEIIQQVSLIKKLKSGKPLVVKLGIDPTTKELHLGHYLVLQKLREFQDLGHQATLVIGDFTAMIGDPSGRDTKRAALSRAEIKQNMSQYQEQAGKIIDLDKINIVYNSSWLDKLGMEGIIDLAGKATFNQIIERKEFKGRLKKDNLSLLEFFYPLLQAYDSVVLKADVELGGLDQKLNLLMGRQIQKKSGQPEQDLVLTPLLIGTDGVEKMSKTAGNYVSLTASAEEMYGKIMSIPDNIMRDYFVYCTRLPIREIKSIFSGSKEGTIRAIDVKKKLAGEIVKIYSGSAASARARAQFERSFQKGEGVQPVIKTLKSKMIAVSAIDILLSLDMVKSKSQARRLIEQGGVKINNQKVTAPDETFNLGGGSSVQIGKLNAIEVKIGG